MSSPGTAGRSTVLHEKNRGWAWLAHVGTLTRGRSPSGTCPMPTRSYSLSFHILDVSNGKVRTLKDHRTPLEICITLSYITFHVDPEKLFSVGTCPKRDFWKSKQWQWQFFTQPCLSGWAPSAIQVRLLEEESQLVDGFLGIVVSVPVMICNAETTHQWCDFCTFSNFSERRGNRGMPWQLVISGDIWWLVDWFCSRKLGYQRQQDSSQDLNDLNGALKWCWLHYRKASRSSKHLPFANMFQPCFKLETLQSRNSSLRMGGAAVRFNWSFLGCSVVAKFRIHKLKSHEASERKAGTT